MKLPAEITALVLEQLADALLRDDYERAMTDETSPGVWPYVAYALACKYESDEQAWERYGVQIVRAMQIAKETADAHQRKVLEQRRVRAHEPVASAAVAAASAAASALSSSGAGNGSDLLLIDQYPELAEFVREKLTTLKREQLKVLLAAVPQLQMWHGIH